MRKRITIEEINKLYENFKTPDRVRAHCAAVSDTGVKIAEELNRHGYHLDTVLIERAGLAHDVARTCESHDIIGWETLKRAGYEDEAEIIRVHMRYPEFNPVDKLNECDIVCLADRIVKEDKYVGLDERIDYIIKKAAGDTDAICQILKNKEKIKILIDQIEKIIGISFDRLLKGGSNEA